MCPAVTVCRESSGRPSRTSGYRIDRPGRPTRASRLGAARCRRASPSVLGTSVPTLSAAFGVRFDTIWCQISLSSRLAAARWRRASRSVRGCCIPWSTFLAAPFAALFFGGPAPDACVLPGLQRPLEAIPLHVARAADRLCRLDLRERRTGGTDGEKDLGIDVSTGCSVPPVHRRHPHSSLRPR